MSLSRLQIANEERRRLHHEADVVIVGAGVFGCAAAYALAEQGRSVLLLERWMKEPDRIVGELLQPGGVEALEALGLADCLEGIDAVAVKGYEVIYYGEPVAIPYPTSPRSQNTKAMEGQKGGVSTMADSYRNCARHAPPHPTSQ